MKISRRSLKRYHRGFTLVELLVVITMVAVLALTGFMFARKGLDKASASKSLSRMRQSGMILLADAQDKNGRMRYAVDAQEKESEFLPYNIVRASLGIEISENAGAIALCDIMHWDVSKLKPATYPINCLGANFTNIINVPDDQRVEWLEETIATDAGELKVRSLLAATVGRPESYPFLMNSSNSKGEEVYSIREDSGSLVGLRNSGKAHGYFLDGSARELGMPELKNAGFTRVYDNSTKPPKPRVL